MVRTLGMAQLSYGLMVRNVTLVTEGFCFKTQTWQEVPFSIVFLINSSSSVFHLVVENAIFINNVDNHVPLENLCICCPYLITKECKYKAK